MKSSILILSFSAYYKKQRKKSMKMKTKMMKVLYPSCPKPSKNPKIPRKMSE
jgi:hypothetical protein